MRLIGFYCRNSQHSVEFILPNNLHCILPAKTEDVPSSKIPGISLKEPQQSIHRDMQRSGTKNNAIPREGAFSRPAMREGQGKAATEMAGPRGSNRPIAAPKARLSVESGSINKAEISRTSERKRYDRACHKKVQKTMNQISRTEESRSSVSPLPSKYPLSLGLPRSSVARLSESRARENTRRSSASATIAGTGRKSKH